MGAASRAGAWLWGSRNQDSQFVPASSRAIREGKQQQINEQSHSWGAEGGGEDSARAWTGRGRQPPTGCGQPAAGAPLGSAGWTPLPRLRSRATDPQLLQRRGQRGPTGMHSNPGRSRGNGVHGAVNRGAAGNQVPHRGCEQLSLGAPETLHLSPREGTRLCVLAAKETQGCCPGSPRPLVPTPSPMGAAQSNWAVRRLGWVHYGHGFARSTGQRRALGAPCSQVNADTRRSGWHGVAGATGHRSGATRLGARVRFCR